ncbi:hypothetical protein EAF04_000768 [Stromatinia cepivora]|nr:hypothetical protein EAF04_000768 [Stromatinia cepivora]
MSSRFWTSSPSSEEDPVRGGKISDKEREAEDRAYEKWTQEQEPWEWSRTRRRAASPIPPEDPGNPEFFQGASRPKSTKQKKQEERAEDRKRRQKARHEAEDAARAEKRRLRDMNKWEYAKLWSEKDREAQGTAFDDFESSAADFIKDNTKEFPRLRRHGCARRNCVKGELLGVCHHDVEATLRGSGIFDEKMIKKERLRWHPDRWTGKGELQEKCNELFQLIQRIIDGDLKA